MARPIPEVPPIKTAVGIYEGAYLALDALTTVNEGIRGRGRSATRQVVSAGSTQPEPRVMPN